jgi:magnesium-transporting ATPase (P-type)
MADNHPNDGERTPLLKDIQREARQEQGQRHVVEDLGPFQLQPVELYECVGNKDADGLAKLLDNGGIDKLLELLLTDERKGLAQDDEQRDARKRIYGANELPKKQMKSFLQMLWEAFYDRVLIILSVAAIVSFGLGLYQDFGPQHDPDEPRVQWIEGVSISQFSWSCN